MPANLARDCAFQTEGTLMSDSDKDEGGKTAAAPPTKQAWSRPQLTKLAAGDAEHSFVVFPDGGLIS
jgi:hypothetical protein